MPRDEGFYPLFNQAVDNAAACAGILRELVSRPADAADLVDKLRDAEHRGDDLVKQVHNRLDTAVVTPFDREDIFTLIEHIDNTVDELRSAGEFLTLHNIVEPLPGVNELAEVLCRTADATARLVAKLPRLRDLKPDLQEIDQLETEGDGVYRATIAELFGGEFKAFFVLRWKDVVESMEDALNSMEKTANTVNSIAVKHA
jgi:predicted phosphate transport protein (TIGR00153 family)